MISFDWCQTKESGIPWYGLIPSYWMPCPLKFRLLANDGGVWGEDSDDNDTMVLRSTEVQLDGSWRIEEQARRRLTVSEKSAGLLRRGDLVVAKSSGSPDHLGKTAIVTAEIEEIGCAFSNFMQRLRVDARTSPKYVFYFLNPSDLMRHSDIRS